MRKITLLLSLMVVLGLSAQTYKEDFETETFKKTSYASETVTLNGYDWNFTGANAGSSDNDWKIGTKSARLAGTTKSGSNSEVSKIEMLTNKTGGIGNITFQYRQYGTDAQIPWKVEWSSNGTTWTTIGEITGTADVKVFSFDLNQPAARIRIIANGFATSSANGKRLNVDDIIMTDNNATGTPVLSVTPANLDFGIVVSGTSSEAQTLTVTAANLTTVPTVTISGTDAAMFTQTGELTVDGGTLSVTFTPTSTGAKAATLTVASGELTESVELTGTATDASNPYGLDDSTPLKSLNETFGDGTAKELPAGWISVSEQGDRKWEIKAFKENNYAQMSAYGGTGIYQTLLISPAIDFDAIDKKAVKFDWKSGYTNGAELKVYVMTKDGAKTAVKSINDNANPSAYGADFTTETLDLSAYSGVKFLVFEYNGDADNGQTTTYQVDNVIIDMASSVATTKYEALKLWSADDKVMFTATSGEAVEIYNTIGQRLYNALATDGQNEITLNQRGVVIVKVGNRVGKLIL